MPPSSKWWFLSIRYCEEKGLLRMENKDAYNMLYTQLTTVLKSFRSNVVLAPEIIFKFHELFHLIKEEIDREWFYT